MERKEQIKDRMLKTAARIWDQANIRDEGSFDPLVGMLVSACASEIENVSREISQSQNRVTEKLMDWINPEINGGVKPDHSIASAQPTEDFYHIKNDFRFYTKARDTDSTVSEYQFLPAGNFDLYKGEVKYIANSQEWYEITNSYQKSPIAYQTKKGPIKNSEIWLGIKLPTPLETLKNFHLFFDLKGHQHRKDFFDILQKAKWYHKGSPLSVKSGITQSSNQSPWIEKIFKGQMNVYNNCIDQIANYYQQQFICIKELSLDQPEKVPLELFEHFNISQDNEDELHWIKLCFNSQAHLPSYDNLLCFINAFPVVNLSLQRKIFRTGNHLNLHCLIDDDHFFDIKNIENDNGHQFMEYNAEDNSSHNSYLIRQEGVGSYENKNIAKTISYLLGKLRNESSNNLVRSQSALNDLKKLDQITNKLQHQLSEMQSESSPTYLFLYGQKESETVFVDYWTTRGAISDNIREYSQLKVFEGSEIMQPGPLLLSPLCGGRDKLTPEELIQSNRHLILSGNKIVTHQDIESCVKVHFGAWLSEVSVEKGIMESQNTSIGLLRTVDITVKAEYNGSLPDELLSIGKDFLADLENRATNIFPYRLYINDQQIEK